MCEGSCELGDPSTPTHEERIDGEVLHTLRLFAKGKLSEKEAWNKLTDILEAERQSCENIIACGILNEMKGNLAHPAPDRTPMMQGFMGGIDTSLTVLNKIVHDLLKPNRRLM